MKSLNAFMAGISKEETQRDITSHHPSSGNAIIKDKVEGRCLRALYYGWTKTPETNPLEEKTFLKFWAGNLIHDGYFNEREKQGEKVQREVSFKLLPEVTGLKKDISGRLDGIEGDDHGVEIKTIYGRGVDFIQANGPKIDNIMQIQPYLKSGLVKSMELVYLDFDSGWRASFDIPFDERLYNSMIARWGILENRLEAKETPERDYQALIIGGEFKRDCQRNKIKIKGDWHCNYCNWRGLCWKGIVENIPGEGK